VATEGKHYASLFSNRGLKVEEKRGRQKTLLGNEVEYHTVSGFREGGYRITVHLEPGPTRAQLVIHAIDKERANRAAKRLRDLGFQVDVEEERVSATKRQPSISTLSEALDAAEEATRR
jgi:hypothetical protein